MQRIILSANDLARVKIAESISPAVEAIFAVDALRDAEGEYFRAWRGKVWRNMVRPDARMERVMRLTRVRGGSREVWGAWSGSHDPEAGHSGDGVLAPGHVVPAVQDLCHLAVMPSWSRVRLHLDTIRAECREIMSGDGLQALFERLDPGIRWNAPVLEIEGHGQPQKLKPRGAGLVLLPSLFAQSTAIVLPAAVPGEERAPVLVFPALPYPVKGHLLDEEPIAPPVGRRSPENLAALLGRTRAAALRALREDCTNGELAEKLGVSTAAVSQHTAVLRGAGLISTHRRSSRVVHTVTPLGHLLLGGESTLRGPGPQIPPRARHSTSV
ncbi:putative regulatory protein [Streptomyces sp. L-9-10]|uniref:ArsR/SmtB family transcription factor n=1 Tax=Streptomyces sp. L-9-10 TaxID=1478131 RepID=UPI00101BEE15|nr:winged helix-turn-helix domain-containing protein [Streptomyces sp. L-9-10]RYJ20071.1 putative regulatory protein [Streptomyces sp. L-9-10]